MLEPRADPSAVVAAEIALLRESRELGRAEALRRTAAPGALMDQPGGAATPERHAPSTIWSSCDGTLAVSYGRTRTAEGLVGNFLTVWQRENDRRGAGEYRWLFLTSAADVPQPAPPPPPADTQKLGEYDILVPGLDLVEGKVAQCPPRAARRQPGERAAEPRADATQPAPGMVHTSRDETLRWRWSSTAAGARQVTVEAMRDGAWQEVIAYLAPAGNG